VPMTGWRREDDAGATGLPWVLPSPNMPTLDTAYVYPGMCLVEGTELSEGRGTTRPFELVGAPFVSYAEARALADALTREDLPGVRFRPVVFTPTFQKHAGRRCGGVQLHVVSRPAFRSYLTGVAVRERHRALEALGRSELEDDPRFNRLDLRSANMPCPISRRPGPRIGRTSPTEKEGKL